MDACGKSPQRGVFESPKGSGIWHICYYDADHQRHRERVGTKQQAIAAYQLRKTEIRLGKFFPPRRDTIRFAELVKRALEHKRARLAPQSYQSDKLRAEKLLKNWKDLAAGAITPQRIEERLAQLGKGGVTPPTLNRYCALLSSIFTFAVKNGYVAENPVRAVGRYKENEGRIRYLTEDEEAGLRLVIARDCPERMAEFDLALNTGMRRGEQFGMRWDHIDIEGRRATVHGKTGRRFIPLNDAACRAIRTLHARSGGSAYVSPEARYNGQRDWRRWFEDAVRIAGVVNFRWHDLRHTFASRLVMAGIDLRTVQELLGHRSILMTMRYAHLAPSHLAEAVAKLDSQTPRQGQLFSTASKTATTGNAPELSTNRAAAHA